MRIEIPDQSRVIAHYGADAQALVHCEECGELAQAVSKMRRAFHSGKDEAVARENLIEEAADVLICIRQIQQMYIISDDDLQAMVVKKCERQEARL